MANQTITTNTNFDTLTGLLAGETVTINSGATLVIDSDPQLNRVLPGNITINDGLFFVDGTKVRELNFSGASSLPAIGDTLTAGSVTGQVIGVLGTTTAGSIRLRSLNGSIANGTALSFSGGKTATASSSDRVGWLNILGAETRTISISRLGEIRARGEWYQLGISNGTASQTFQHYCTTQIGAIWVETGNDTGIYEIWVNAGSRFPASVGIAERGRYFGMSGSTITFGNGTNGNIPANGARIQVPNITIGSALIAAPTTPTVNSDLGSWWEISTGGGGTVDFDKVSIGAFYINATSPQGFSLTDCGALLSVACTSSQLPVLIDRVGIGGTGTIPVESALNLQNSIDVSVTDCHIARAYTSFNSANPAVSCQSMSGVLERNLICVFNRQSIDPCVTIASADNVSLVDCSLIGGRLAIGSSSDITITNIAFSDRSGTSGNLSTIPMNAIGIGTGSRNITIDGYRVLSSQSLPMGYFISISASKNVKIRNIDYNAATHTVGLVAASLCDQVYISNCNIFNSQSVGIDPAASAKNVIIQNCSFGYNNPIFNSGLDMQQRSLIGGSAGLNTTTGIRVSRPSAIGTHFVDAFTSATTGALVILGNEKSTNSPSVFSYEASAGVRFNGVGGALLRSLGDQITWTWPWFILGHTAFANLAFAFNGTNQSNHSFEYRLDTGSGFSGSWKALTGANLSAETINSNPGFRLQVRASCIAADPNNAINGILIRTLTTATDQLTLHPPIGLAEATLSFTGLIPGSEIRIFRNSDSAELAGVELSGGTFAYTYTYAGVDVAVSVNIIKPGYVYQTIPLALTASSNSLPIQQRVDYSYA